MSKLSLYVFGFLILLLVAGFAYVAFSPSSVDQNEILIEIPADRFE